MIQKNIFFTSEVIYICEYDFVLIILITINSNISIIFMDCLRTLCYFYYNNTIVV